MEEQRESVTELGWRERDQIPELFVKCHCAAEGLEISYYSEKNNGSDMFHLVFWETGRKKVSSIPWKERWGADLEDSKREGSGSRWGLSGSQESQANG